MPQFMPAWTVSLRRRLAWSNSRQAWTERIAGGALLAAIVALLWFGGSLVASRRVVLWGLLLVAAAGLMRRGWVHLFGPVLFYELLRIGRRSRYVVVRCLYAFALLVFLLCVYGVWRETARIVHGAMAPRDLAQFAASFFYVFAGMQLGIVILLTPAYTAGVLAEEKERGTLEALLATDLRNREIVLGLFLARLLNLTLLLLTGLPILSFLQFLGGVDPNLVVSAFVTAGCTMISLASVSFVCSLYARRSRDAIVRSYLLTVGYLVLSGLSWLLLLPQLKLTGFPSTEKWLSPITLADVVHAFNYGNIVSLAFQLANGVIAGRALNDLLWDAIPKYAWFHGLIAAGCCAGAVLRLRVKGLEQLTRDSDRREGIGRVRLNLLPLRDRPMLWKELVAEGGDRRGLIGLFVNGCLLALLAMPVLQVMYFHGRLTATEPNSRLTDLINLWVRGASVLLGCLLLLQVAVRAAGSVSGERGRQTLDGLLATALANREILAGKWLGSILGPRRVWLGLAVVWVVGIATGALHPLAPVCFVLAWLVYAGFLAGLALWTSVAHRSTHRAMFWTLFLLGAALVASWLAAFDLAGYWLNEQQALGVSPPLALGLLMFSPVDVKSWAEATSEWPFPGILLGLSGWAAAAYVLWALAKIRFRVVTGREAGLVGPAENGLPLPVIPLAAVGHSANTAVGSTPGNVSRDEKAQPRQAAPQRRFSLRSWLRLAGRTVVVLLPPSLLIGEYVHLDRVADDTLREALAEADHLDPGWRLDDLEAKRQFTPPEQELIWDASGLLPPEWWKDEHDLSAETRWPQRQLRVKQHDALRKGLERVRAALIKARRLADMPCGHLSRSVLVGGPWQDLSAYPQQARSIGKLLGHDVDLRAEERDADGALVSCRALLNSGRAMDDEPQFSFQLVRIDLQHEAVLKMERTLAQGEPTETTLAPLQRLLAEEDRHPAILLALRGSRAWADRMLENLQNGKAPPGWNVYPVPRNRPAVPQLPRDQELDWIASGSFKGQRAALLRLYTELVETAKLPFDQMDARLTQTITSLRGSNRPTVILYFLNPLLVQRRPENARLRSAVVALAVERYRRKYGRWPDTLDALVPAFLPEVPLDPHDGKRLRYRRLTDGVVIYSVGPDLIDDGGKLDRLNRSGGGMDVGVQLWDVKHRRQPSMPESPH
jgi:ABC-type transport system involved in multi-copper enzyme maturation permease subunit